MSQFRNKKRNKKNLYFLIILIVIFLLFIFKVISFSGGFFQKIGLPFWNLQKTTNEKIPPASFFTQSKISIVRENLSLKDKVSELELKLVDYDLLFSENEELKSLFNRTKNETGIILGVVLTKPNRSFYDSIIIDIGEEDGLIGGEQVFTDADIPIGKISKVYKSTSTVLLYSSPQEKTEAVINEINATVELIGRGGGNFEMIVPNELPSDPGTLIVFPGIKSYVVAMVEKILSKPTDPVKKVLLRSPINIQELKWVQVKLNEI